MARDHLDQPALFLAQLLGSSLLGVEDVGEWNTRVILTPLTCNRNTAYHVTVYNGTPVSSPALSHVTVQGVPGGQDMAIGHGGVMLWQCGLQSGFLRVTVEPDSMVQPL